ncbi:PREDICTED: uncharacterized protein LOC105365851 [Ceratosolen solmsi marchali]|uniref:Uncharacterized protein LOC105365851 n=1 Tax=Ceratosolen solmsi marchali TaxID=326594 RepID=A0AAJ7DZS5_9HYME|nr:PREDICTED: uncharacterized protein LOC105365851 [Ceratosolen solmsi marchali]
MENLLDQLLKKLKIDHVFWYKDRADMYYEVIFPVASGDSCENCLHSLAEFGIGIRMNSIVSVLPTQCTLRGLKNIDVYDESIELNQKYNKIIINNIPCDKSDTWKEFIASIRSKLTVKQVIDGVQDGGQLTFDFVLLVLIADY